MRPAFPLSVLVPKDGAGNQAQRILSIFIAEDPWLMTVSKDVQIG